MNRRFGILTILSSLLSIHSSSGTPEALSLDVARELSSFVAVEHRSGRHYAGQLERTSPNTVSITVKAGEGEVVYTFDRKDILEFSFPGESIELQIEEKLLEEDYSGALPFLEALYNQRSTYLDLLDKEEVARFLPLAVAYRVVGRPGEAIALSNHLRDLTKSKKIKMDLTDIILLAQYELGAVDESALLALEWTQEAPRFHSSALGWWILGKIAFGQGDFHSALWTSLYPVVFSTHLPMDYLAECYALSIASEVSLDRSNKALKLYHEMTERGLAWPKDPELLPYRERITTLADGLQ